MKLNEYQKQAMSTCLPTCDNMAYALGLLHEEAGELQGKIDKAIRKGLVVWNNNNLGYKDDISFLEFRDSLIKELGDCLWACAAIARQLGVSLDAAACENLDKLAKRKKYGTIDGKGDGVTAEERW